MMVITFSGLDGSGKSTHVEAAARFFEDRGYRVRPLTSYRISVSGLAASALDAIRRRHPGDTPPREISATGHVIERLPGDRTFDEDRHHLSTRLQRLIGYPVDSLILRLWLLLQRLRGVEAVVIDRYVFDKLVNLPRPDGAIARFLVWLTPRADLAVLLDVPPEVCRARREEHPADYYRSKHALYRRVAAVFGMKVVPNEDMHAATTDIADALTEIAARGGP